jgi:tRNA uridine 5-carboxymethylaminomethyl modification enzyme
VRGPRSQIDRKLYREAMQAELFATIRTSTSSPSRGRRPDRGSTPSSWASSTGPATYRASRVVLTTGTFLKGVIHRGETRISAGRVGDAPSIGLSDRLYALGFDMGRLKTGTPARLDGKTIAWDRLEMQAADEQPVPFSFLTDKIDRPQIACGITYTTEETHRIIAERLGESAVYGGRATGIGPRYCPSIEDKVVRFADKTSHQIFLEPEGLDDDTVYPNGISTSVSAETQDLFLRTIPGLELSRSAATATPSNMTTSIRASSTRRWRPRRCRASTWPARSMARRAMRRRAPRAWSPASTPRAPLPAQSPRSSPATRPISAS